MPAVPVSDHDLSKLTIDRNAPAMSGRSRRWRTAAWIAGAAVVAFLVYHFLPDRAVEVQTIVATSTGGGGGAVGGATAVTANGYVVARTRAAVAAKIPGRLATLNVSEGSYVRANDVIARLENDDHAAAVQEARANELGARAQVIEAVSVRDQAERDADRLRRIHADNPQLTSAQQVEVAASLAAQAVARAAAAEARLEAAGATLRLAEATFENTIIRAPFSGTVLRKEAEVGEVVAPSVGGGLTRGAVVTMADLTTLEVEVDVNEAYIGRVLHEQRARITLDAYPDTSFRGTVRQVVPTADRQRATVQVKVSIVDRDSRILPEMGARVDFLNAPQADAATTGAGDAPRRFQLPVAAVRESGGRSIVWLVRDGRLEERVVDAGPVSAGFREIRNGLAGGELILSGGVESPVAGMRVRVPER